jgi:hypothetical protein
MKVVYNTRCFGLKLTVDEMQTIADDLGFKISTPFRNMPKSSDHVWFQQVYWEAFRSHPYLVALVEAKTLTNQDLCVVEIPDGENYYIDTDWALWERVEVLPVEDRFEQYAAQ